MRNNVQIRVHISFKKILDKMDDRMTIIKKTEKLSKRLEELMYAKK